MFKEWPCCASGTAISAQTCCFSLGKVLFLVVANGGGSTALLDTVKELEPLEGIDAGSEGCDMCLLI